MTDFERRYRDAHGWSYFFEGVFMAIVFMAGMFMIALFG